MKNDLTLHDSLKEIDFQALLRDYVLDAVLLTTMDGNVRYWNRTAEALFGLSAAASEAQVETVLRAHWAEIGAQLQSEGYWRGTLQYQRADGQWLYLETQMALVRDKRERPTAVMVTSRDITAERRLIQQMENQQAFLRQIIDTNPNIIFVKNAEGRFTLANKALADSLGTTPESLIGKSDADLNPNTEEVRQYQADDALVLQTMEARLVAEEPATYANGELHWHQAIKVPFVAADGQKYILGIGIDITERKRAEEERERLHQQIVDAQREALRELSTPIIPLFDGILVMPLIGSIDTLRARDIMRSLLAGVSQYKAQIVILDITGVPLVDTGVANHLDKAIQAVRLKGAKTVVTGISDAVAETIVDLGIDWSKVDVQRDLQAGLKAALERLGMKVGR
ncbi:MAG: PAS domain S-box protein [Chloroflexi bacterium]|nr:PAS domain S-box protein [Chloroflexota bacterium]